MREPFTPPGKGPERPEIPARDRPSHGASLRQQLQAVAAVTPVDEEPEVPGLNVEFESFPDVELAFESLSRERSGIELRNVRTDGPRTLATVFIPFGKLPLFEHLIARDLQGAEGATGRKVDHQRLIDAVAHVRVATLRALWTDDGPFPTDEATSAGGKCGCPPAPIRVRPLRTSGRPLEVQGLQAALGDVRFPERSVLLVKAAPQQLKLRPRRC